MGSEIEDENSFESFIKENINNTKFFQTLLFITFLGTSVLSFYVAIELSAPALCIYGVIMIVVAFFYHKKHRGVFKGGSYWADLATAGKDDNEIVWIKPIIVKEKLAHIITVSETQHFQFHAKNGLNATINCDTDERREIFLTGIKEFLPNAHLGYTPEVNSTYEEDPRNFIHNLKAKSMYVPVSRRL